MTPLAHAIAKQIVLPLKKRKPVVLYGSRDPINHSDVVYDIHCFETTEVLDLACDLVDSGKLLDVISDRFFLPAPRTWIEHRREDKRRAGWLLTEAKGQPLLRLIAERDSDFIVDEGALGEHHMQGLVLAMLAIINTPKIVGRQQFWPHRGLERDLIRNSHGKYPLHAWHVLKLRVSKPPEIDDGEPHEAHLTGRRALHFCRSHLRVRLGQIEFVTSHWRGDAALGIKQTRYDVVR